MNITAALSTFTAFAVLLFTRLLYRQRRLLASLLSPLPTLHHLLGQIFKQVLYITTWFRTCLTKRQLIFISYVKIWLPKAYPSSKLTTRLESRSILFPTITQLTFWLIDLRDKTTTCSFSRTSELHSRNSLCQWCRRQWWSHLRCDSNCWWWF